MDSQFKHVIVISDGNAGGQISIQIEQNRGNRSASIQALYVGEKPMVGENGLALFMYDGRGFENRVYYLGKVNGLSIDKTNNIATKLPKGAQSITGSVGDSYVVAGDQDIVLSACGSNLTINQQIAEFNVGGNDFSLAPDGLRTHIYDDNKHPLASIEMSNRSFEISGESDMLLIAGGDMKIQTDGNMIICARGKDSTNYQPLHYFHVLAKRVVLDAGSGPIQGSASNFSLKLSSSLVGSSNGAPGLGPSEAFDVEIVQGDAQIVIGLGDATLMTLDPIGNVTIQQGIPLLLNNSLSLGPMETILNSQTVEGIGASLTLTPIGTSDLSTFLTQSFTSMLGGIEFQAMLEASITSAMSVALTAPNINLIAAAVMSIITPMLDLSGAAMIQTGPGMAAPTGTGPFCALPVCCFTGAPHISNIYTG